MPIFRNNRNLKIRVLSTHKLLLTRKADTKGEWIAGAYVEDESEDQELEVVGSLQPYKKGTTTIDLPDGVYTNDIKIFYTRDDIKTADEFDKSSADTVEINGFKYYAKMRMEQSGFPTVGGINHNAVVFIRENLNTGKEAFQ